MNEQNNFNSQNNSLDNNVSNNPMHTVKNRFFNQELFTDANVSDVGTSTTEQVNNLGINNFILNNKVSDNNVGTMNNVNQQSFNVNQPLNDMNSQSTDVDQQPVDGSHSNHFAGIFSQDLLEDVNASVYPSESLNETEVLDTLDGDNNVETMVETLDDGFGINEFGDLNKVNNIYDNQNNDNNGYNQVIGAAAPVFNQNVGVQDMSNAPLIDNDMIAQQPLSLNSLGASPVNQQDIPDLDDNSKYFPSPDPIINKEKEMIAQAQQKIVKNVTAIDSILDDDVVVIDETALIKAYVGPKYSKYFKSNFSGFAMFFGSLAFFCRGMYLIGLIIFAFQVIVLFMFKDIPYIILAILVILAFIMAMIINPLYFSMVKKKVTSIRKKHPKVSQGEMNNLCAKLGKNNILIALLLQIILIALTVFGAIKLLGTDYFVDIYENAKNKILKINKKEEVKFDGVIKYNDLNIEEYFSITVPDTYRQGDETDFSYYYVTEGTGENNSCSFNFGGVDGFDSSKELIDKLAVYHEKEEDVDSVKFNGLDWYLLYVDQPEGKVYYRATDVDGKVILFEFLSGVDTPVGVCDSQIVILLDSIEGK